MSRISASSLMSGINSNRDRPNALRRTQPSLSISKRRTARLSSSSQSGRLVDLTIHHKKSKTQKRRKNKNKAVFGKALPKLHAFNELTLDCTRLDVRTGTGTGPETLRNGLSTVKFNPNNTIEPEQQDLNVPIKEVLPTLTVADLFDGLLAEGASSKQINSMLLALWDMFNSFTTSEETKAEAKNELSAIIIGKSNEVRVQKLFSFLSLLIENYNKLSFRARTRKMLRGQLVNLLNVLWKTCVILPEFVGICFEHKIEELLTKFLSTQLDNLAKDFPYLVESNDGSKVMSIEHIDTLIEYIEVFHASFWFLGSLSEPIKTVRKKALSAQQQSSFLKLNISRMKKLLSKMQLLNANEVQIEQEQDISPEAHRQKLLETGYLSTLSAIYGIFFNCMQLLKRSKNGAKRQKMISSFDKLSSATAWMICSAAKESSETSIDFFISSVETLYKVLRYSTASQYHDESIRYVLLSLSHLTWNSPTAIEAVMAHSTILQSIVQLCYHKSFDIRNYCVRILSNLSAGPKTVVDSLVNSGLDVIQVLKQFSLEVSREEFALLETKLSTTHFEKLCIMKQEAIFALSNIISESPDYLESTLWNNKQEDHFLEELIALATFIPSDQSTNETCLNGYQMVALSAKNLLFNAIKASSDVQFVKLLRCGILDVVINFVCGKKCEKYFETERSGFLLMLSSILTRSSQADITIKDLFPLCYVREARGEANRSNVAVFLMNQNGYWKVLDNAFVGENDKAVKEAYETVLRHKHQ